MRKNILIIMSLLAGTVSRAAVSADYRQVLPEPQTITAVKGKPFLLTKETTIFTPTGNADMERNANFLSRYIQDQTGIKANVSDTKGKKGISLVLNAKDKDMTPEGYRINVTEKGVTITAATPAGVFYGIQTLRKALPVTQQACKMSGERGKACKSNTPTDTVTLAAAVIADAPRFGYRGMMLDCSRHFWKVDEVKAVIDMLALHNINRFHWHLTDDQGWRFEVPGYPKLTTVGAKRAATVIHRNSELTDETPYGPFFYTDDEIRDIVKYAADRYITIMPEVDMPGHMMAALASYPELGCTGGPYQTGQYWGVYPDILCAGNQKVYDFVKAVFDKVCDLFPTSEYIHIGGDESPRVRWENCPKCQDMIAKQGIKAKSGKSKEALLQGYFDRRVQAYLETKGRKIVGWDELLGCDVDTTATIMSWQGAEPGAKGAKIGHDIIMAPNRHCYFDFNQAKEAYWEPTNCYGTLPIKQVYDWNPVPSGVSDKVAAHIKGVQANVWCEYITRNNVLEYMILPRLAALSEVQWMQQDKRNFDEFKRRATSLRHIYERYGWTYAHHLWPEEFRKEAKKY